MNSPTFYQYDHRRLVIVTAIFILLALIVAYQPVIFNYFCSDDFYIVCWLDQCKQNVSLLFKAVYEGTPYYRPVLNLLFFVEYLLCGANGVCFRLVSLSYLLITAFILWQLVAVFANEIDNEEIPSQETESYKKKKINWSLFSVGFFLLFPLHTEPINWFVGSTELLANIFMLTSFLFFVRWRKERRFVFQLISYTSAICAFLTKEITVVLPALLLLYELLVYDKQSILAKNFLRVIRVTIGYWFLLVIYLCLRKIMTGHFLGNWSNVVFHFSSNQMMFKAWWQSIKMIISPISSAAFGNNIAIWVAWILMLVDLAFLTVAYVYKSRKKVLLLLFLISWFFISLVPMARLLLITPDLLDARYGYIASVPLCILLMMGLAYQNKPRGIEFARYIVFIVILVFSCFVLRTNNSAWAEAGRLTNNMLGDFNLIHKQVPNETKIYFINIPVRYKGVAIAGLKSIDSMNHIPFANYNYDNCIWLLNEDQSLPIGLMSSDLKEGKINARFYYLRAADKHFVPIRFFKSKHVKKPQFLPAPRVVPGRNSVFIFSPVTLECKDCDALVLKLKTKPVGIKDAFARLTFINDIKSDENSDESLLAPLSAQAGEQTLIFPLRGKPIWTFGGVCRSIKVSFPKDYAVEIKSARAISLEKEMPRLSFSSENFDNQVGQVNLNLRHPQSTIGYDASSIINCAGIRVEIIDSSQYFGDLNSASSNTVPLINWQFMKAKGQITFDRAMLKAPGFYKVRLCPLDKDGKQCAFCSDHFILYIED